MPLTDKMCPELAQAIPRHGFSTESVVESKCMGDKCARYRVTRGGIEYCGPAGAADIPAEPKPEKPKAEKPEPKPPAKPKAPKKKPAPKKPKPAADKED